MALDNTIAMNCLNHYAILLALLIHTSEGFSESQLFYLTKNHYFIKHLHNFTSWSLCTGLPSFILIQCIKGFSLVLGNLKFLGRI